MVRTITGKTKGKAKERPKRQAACINQRRERASPSRDKNLSSRSRTSISRQRNLPISIAENSLASSFRTKKTNQQTRNPAAAASSSSCYYCPESFIVPCRKQAPPWALLLLTGYLLTVCTSVPPPCCVEQRRHKNPLSQPVPDLHPNLHPKSRCTQISLSPSLSNWSCYCWSTIFLCLSFFLCFFSTNSCLAQRDHLCRIKIVDMTIIHVYSNELTIVPFF
jgi:hypothetical protein